MKVIDHYFGNDLIGGVMEADETSATLFRRKAIRVSFMAKKSLE